LSKKSTQNSSIKFEVAGVSLILASIYIYISLFSTSSGIVGEKIRELALGIFGLGAYIVPVLIIILGLAMVYRKNAMQVNIKFYSFCIFLLATLIALFLANYKEVEGAGSQWLDAIKYYYALGALNAGGGALGGFFGYAFVMLFGIVGTITIVAALYIISILMFTEITFVSILEYLRNVITGMYARFKDRSKETAITMELQKKTAAKSKEELELIASDEERIRNMDKKIKILDFTKRFDKDFKNKDDKDIEEKPKELPKENM
jgi:S-DNA-T family DNA segregation ATPase FtsK/SpoIIIE